MSARWAVTAAAVGVVVLVSGCHNPDGSGHAVTNAAGDDATGAGRAQGGIERRDAELEAEAVRAERVDAARVWVVTRLWLGDHPDCAYRVQMRDTPDERTSRTCIAEDVYRGLRVGQEVRKADLYPDGGS